MSALETLGISLPMFLAQLVNFLIVLFVLWKFAYRPIVAMLDARTQKIEESVKNSAEIERRVSELDADHRKVILIAKSEASALIETARLDAESRKDALIDQAKKEVEQLVAHGKVQLNAEKVQMLHDAKEELVFIAVEATKKILESTVDEKKSQKLAADVVLKMVSYEGDK